MAPDESGREHLLLALLRAALALAGRRVDLWLERPDGTPLAHLRGTLGHPYRQPLDPSVVTLGFQVEGQRLDLHLSNLLDVTTWNFDVENRRINALHLVLSPTATLQITEVIDDAA